MKRPSRRKTAGALDLNYFAVVGAAVEDDFFLWLLCLWLLLLLVLLPLVVDGAEEAAGVSPAFGASAAMAAAAIPKDNKAEVIKVPVLFMGSPAVVFTCEPKNTPDR